MTKRLADIVALAEVVKRPQYTPAEHGTGIVHLGLGAFHKAHQALYTDEALAAAGGDWRIIGVSLRSTEPSKELTQQNGLYTLLERDVSGTQARVVGSIARALSLREDRQAVLDALCDPTTRIVSLTVTEKGYGIDRASGGIDRAHSAIAADLADPERPEGVAGLLVWALGQRRLAATPPFTVLCCDNLPENGRMLRALLVDFVRHAAPELAEHIAEEVAFPSTMVDRITPARTVATLDDARRLTGFDDQAAVDSETFSQWVVEENFPTGRPAWEAGGAVFVEDVAPYEAMKLRMLNGAHSMIAYTGFLAGHQYVRDVMADKDLSLLVRRHIIAARATLAHLPGIDLANYTDSLITRFENPFLAHETYQIAMDGTEKLPQRILAPAVDAIRNGKDVSAFAFATAAWMRFVTATDVDGKTYSLRDPREAELKTRTANCHSADEVMDVLLQLDGLFPKELQTSESWRNALALPLSTMLETNMVTAIAKEARTLTATE